MLGRGLGGTALPALMESLAPLSIQQDPEGPRTAAWLRASARRAKAEKPQVGRPARPKPSAVATPMRRLVKPPGPRQHGHAGEVLRDRASLDHQLVQRGKSRSL